MSTKGRQTETAETRILMVDCTRTILTAIREGLPQREIANDYGLALVSAAHGADTPDWPAINRAILGRWSMSGLDRIKRDAWKAASRRGVSLSWSNPAPRRDWILVYVRKGDPAYWVAANGELRVPSDVPPREEWSPEMQDCQL
jgi:hypothetical protein